MSQTNNQHAAILREMAAHKAAEIQECSYSDQYADRIPWKLRAKAALLAGAEALEALTVIADGEGDAQVIARQALARLEGK